MRNVSIIKPAFPGGRFSGGALPARALVSSVSNGSRRVAAFSSAGFSTGGLAEFPDAAFAGPLAVPGAFAGAFVEAFVGAFTGAFAVAGPEPFAGEGGGAC